MTDLVDVARRTLPVLDLTNLDDACDEAAARALCTKAKTMYGPVAAVCLWPRFVPLARSALEGSGVRIATVTNFPAGAPDAGADFVKTSTGKTEPGATPEAAAAMLDAIVAARAGRRWAGIKISGGVRTVTDAAVYIRLAEQRLGAELIGPGTFRIGASKLLDDCLAVLKSA